MSVQRDRIVADGVHEDIVLENHSEQERTVGIELRFGADFADIFEIKDRTPKKGVTSAEVGSCEVTLWYRRDGFRRGTRISFSEPGDLREDVARFDVTLGPREAWKTHIDVSCLIDGEERRPRHDCESPGDLQPHMPLTLERWLEEAPRLETDFDPLRHTYRRSLLDLAALRFRPCPSSPASPRRPWRPSPRSKLRRTTPSATPSRERSCTSSAKGSWRRWVRFPTPPTTGATTPRHCS